MENLELSSHPPETRRFDSLARLLEANMTCAAVSLIGNTMYITTNDIYSYSTKTTREIDSQGINHLRDAAKHFLSKDFREDKNFSDADFNILLTNYKGKLTTYYQGQKGAPELEDQEVIDIIKYLFNAEHIQDFMKSAETKSSFFDGFLNDEFLKTESKSKSGQRKIFAKNIQIKKKINSFLNHLYILGYLNCAVHIAWQHLMNLINRYS